MIDFDEKFHKFYEKWIDENSGKYTYDELENKVPEVYETWRNTFDEELGASPYDYLRRLTSDELMSEFKLAFEEGSEPASAILDEIEEREECILRLMEILSSGDNAEIKMHAANILLETGRAGECTDVFTKWVLSTDCEQELRDIAVEILKDYADKVRDKLLNAEVGADIETKTLIAEILICAEKCDKTFELLTELFKSGKNTALYAGYLGKYGDERAAAMLYKALDDCNYLEFTEIRNAIEILGGVVDEDYRDFSDDEYYKAIKHLK